VEIDHLDLRPPLGLAADGPCEMGINESLQVLILGQSDEVGDPLLLAVLVDVRIGKGGVAPKPEKPERGTVSLHDGMDKREGSIGRVNVARPAGHPEVSVVGDTLLAAMGRVLGGVNVDDQPTPVFLQ
jgi:hypothetical protein